MVFWQNNWHLHNWRCRKPRLTRIQFTYLIYFSLDTDCNLKWGVVVPIDLEFLNFDQKIYAYRSITLMPSLIVSYFLAIFFFFWFIWIDGRNSFKLFNFFQHIIFWNSFDLLFSGLFDSIPIDLVRQHLIKCDSIRWSVVLDLND